MYAQIYERLSNGQRGLSNPAVDWDVVAEQPETATWDDDREAARDYKNYAQARAWDGKSHEEAVAYVEKQRTRR